VLISLKDRRFYIGFTRDLKRRIQQHSFGLNASTKSRRTFCLIYYEYHLSKSDAIRRENYFKTTSGKRAIRLMLKASVSNMEQEVLMKVDMQHLQGILFQDASSLRLRIIFCILNHI